MAKLPPPTDDQIRAALLKVMMQLNKNARPGTDFDTQDVLKRAQSTLGSVAEYRIMDGLEDLARAGHIGWGLNFANPGRHWFHLTDRGAGAVANVSRDPANPDGYLAYLAATVEKGGVPWSYIEEALRTYNSGCYKATAVLVGGACEALILDLRDALVVRMEERQISVPAKVKDRNIKTLRDAMDQVFQERKGTMATDLRERVGAHWTGLSEPARRLRNDAGHPTSVDPVTPEDVHANLLLFPEFAKLARDLKTWIATGLQ